MIFNRVLPEKSHRKLVGDVKHSEIQKVYEKVWVN